MWGRESTCGPGGVCVCRSGRGEISRFSPDFGGLPMGYGEIRSGEPISAPGPRASARRFLARRAVARRWGHLPRRCVCRTPDPTVTLLWRTWSEMRCSETGANPARTCKLNGDATGCLRHYAGRARRGKDTDDLPQQPEQERRFRRRPMCCLLSLFCGSAT